MKTARSDSTDGADMTDTTDVDLPNQIPPPLDPLYPPEVVKPDDFREAYGEPIERTLDLSTWLPDVELGRLYKDLEAQIASAVERENELRRTVRATILPRIRSRNGAPPEAGVYRVEPADIAQAHRGILFNGAVEACDGTVVTHDTLALTVTQIGICLVRYHGDSGSWVHRLYRRDLRGPLSDPAEEARRLIERRQLRGGIDQPDRANQLSELAQRGIMAYAERAILLEQATAIWRMGHGNPAPYELLTGSGSMPLLAAALEKLAALIGDHRKFVFVPSAPSDRGLLTIGHALRPLEYAVIDSMTERMRAIVENGHYSHEYRRRALAFVDKCGPQVLLGIYRTSEAGPPQLFYAHPDHVHEAALIALADSSLQEHRAFPTLIELADTVCRTTFVAGDFTNSVRQAYADAGQPFRFLGERETRR